MKRSHISYKLLLTSALATFAFSTPSAAFAQTLSDVVSKTIQNHPQVETSRAALDIAREDIGEQRSAYFPEISATATGGRVYGDNSTSRGLSVTRGAGYSYLWEGSVTARQMVFDAFETKNRIDAARSSEKAAVMELVNTRDDLTLRAVQTYVNLLRARTGHKMVTAYKASVDSYLKRIKALVDEGAADEAELQQARDVSIILKNFEADYMGQIKAAESDYVELTGEMPSGELSLPQAPVDLIPTDMDAALEMVKAEHALIRGAKLLAKSAKYGIEAEKAGYYPDVDGELSFMKSDKDDVIGGEVEDGKAVLRMNWAFESTKRRLRV
jgi:adhesin transport system outer membrane protein